MAVAYWLMKTEPTTYSFEQLEKDGKTNWSGVRNFQARNNLKNAKKGDLVLIYHSGDDKAVVGIAKVSKGAYPDLDPKKPGEWVQVDIEPVKSIGAPVTLKTIKSESKLKTIPLIRLSRLSVMPIEKTHFDKIVELGKAK
jgi:predicted RNA-binding protein with PUA-like domain